MNKLEFSLGILLMILSISMIAGFLYLFENLDKEIKLVDCYDRYGNKLIGETCEQITYKEPFNTIYQEGNIIMFAFIIMFLIGFMWSAVSFLEPELGRREK